MIKTHYFTYNYGKIKWSSNVDLLSIDDTPVLTDNFNSITTVCFTNVYAVYVGIHYFIPLSYLYQAPDHILFF